MVSMVLGLMVACGWGGWYSLGGLGGHQWTWLLCYETWTLLHLLASCYPTPLSSALKPQPFGITPSKAQATMRSQGFGNQQSAAGGRGQRSMQLQNGNHLASTGQLQSSAAQGDRASSGHMLTGAQQQQPGLQVAAGSHPQHTADQSAECWAHVRWIWQHCKMPLYCIAMGVLLPALTGWLPFKISALLPAVVPSTSSETIHGMNGAGAFPVEPSWTNAAGHTELLL